MKRRFGIAILAIAVLVVAIGVWRPWDGRGADASNGGQALQTVRGVIGSEKKDFFADEKVKAAFASHGLAVEVGTAGSREIATTTDLTGVDFAFPSSTAAAEKLAEKVSASGSTDPFFSPMVVVTWKPIAELLQANGVMSTAPDGSWQFDVAAYLALVQANGGAGTRWSDLDGAADVYNSNRTILLGSTDIRTSNSAAMYMDIVSYVENGDRVVTGADEIAKTLPVLTTIFAGQGYSASSSDEPFKDYLVQGMGSKPLVVAYEAQFLGAALNDAASLPDGAIMAYLSPTVYSKHVVVPLTDLGRQVGELLATDPNLQQLAAEHGFRTTGSALQDLLAERGVTGFRSSIIDVADTPSFETTEKLIARIEEALR